MSLDICKSIYISTGDYLLNSTENMFTELCVYIAQTQFVMKVDMTI